MEFSILEPGNEPVLLSTGLPVDFTETILPASMPMVGSTAFGDMCFQNYVGNEFSIWVSHYCFTAPVQLIGRADLPVLELHIQFKNQFDMCWDGFECGLVRPYQYNMSYTPFVNNKVVFEADRLCKTFDIHFTKEYLERMAVFHPSLSLFLELVHKKEFPGKLMKYDQFLTPSMISILNNILGFQVSDGLLSFYLESKVLELLILVLEQVNHEKEIPPIKLSNYDVEMLHEAKRILLSDFESDISLQQLCRAVGINEFKLKKGFKHLFGDTVFGYRHTVRMEKAKLIILETKLDISDIAFMTGFEHPSNFNKAFKKFHGFTAAELRKYGRVKD